MDKILVLFVVGGCQNPANPEAGGLCSIGYLGFLI
jgi:hypothetical protein